MPTANVVSKQEWIEARKALLDQEKEFQRQRDAIAANLRELPCVEVDEDYVFDGPDGEVRLCELFEGHSQLIVQHFMFQADWTEGCPNCSFWADGWDPMVVHLNHRDVSMAAVSIAPIDKLGAYSERMNWTFRWVSSANNDFNRDFNVTTTPEELEQGKTYYNYRQTRPYGLESPGMSVFYRNEDGAIFHTYSTYARGLDRLNAAYHLLDMVPKGRDEGDLPHPMAWVRRHDSYED
ncbi:MAG: DUF899 domain-containing protein [Acidobacteriota bacterium]|nr:DUF899 domain-containing protein [Acidobacteriota bacterium]